jgi:hypothetical protein
VLGTQPEVHEHHPSVLVDQHVRGLDVAVQLAGGVDGRDPASELQEGIAHAGLVDGARLKGARPRRRLAARGLRVEGRRVGRAALREPEQVAKALAAHQLHREKPAPFDASELVQEHQVRVQDAGQRAKLALQLVDARGVRLQQHLERQAPAARQFAHLVHDADAPATEERLHGVAGNARQRRSLLVSSLRLHHGVAGHFDIPRPGGIKLRTGVP